MFNIFFFWVDKIKHPWFEFKIYIFIWNNTHIYQIIKMLHTLNSDIHEGLITYSDYSNTYQTFTMFQVSVLTHLMLTTTFRGRYYSHSYFTKLREVTNWLKITQLVNGVVQIQTPAFWLQNLRLAKPSHCILLFIKQDIDSFRCVCYAVCENCCLRRETSWTKGLSVRIDVAKLWEQNDTIALHDQSRSAGSSAPLRDPDLSFLWQ